MAGAITGLLGAGGGGVIGGAAVRLVLDTSQFNAGLAQAEGRLKSFGTGMSRVGGSLTRGLTLPIVAAGAVATKMALDFNQAFVRIQTLAGDTGQSMESLKTQVLDLAEQTGQDPGGLANALYQVASAGEVAAKQAIPILTAAAKGAALGMGDVNDIAHLLTSTMNAYGPETISAAQAMDTLTQATADSSAEADALATSMGPVIGVAAQVGISFEQVAAALASASNAGIPVERAATGLRFLLTSLKDPTDAAKTSLDNYGISVQELQRMLDTQGLQGTLQSLAETFDLTSVRGRSAWNDLAGGARGAIVANTQVGQSAAAAAQEVDNLGNSAGETERRFEIFGQTITGKNAIALGRLKSAAIQLGEQLIPIFETVVNAVSGLAKAFSALPDGVQSTIVKVAALAALAGPVLKLAGAVATLGSALSGAGAAGGVGGLAAGFQKIAGLTVPIVGASEAVGGLGAAAAGAGTSFAVMTVAGAALIPVAGALAVEALHNATGMEDADEAAKRLFDQWQAGTISAGQLAGSLRGLGPAGQAAFKALQRTGGEAQKAGTNMEKLIDAILTAGRAQRIWGNWLAHGSALTQQQNIALGGLINRFYKYGGSLNAAKTDALRAAIATGDYSTAIRILQGAIDKLPQKKQVKIEADTKQANNAIHVVQSNIDNMHGTTIPITVTYTTSGRPPVGGPAGSVNRFASGGITRGPAYMVGEGSYSTFAGRGAEAVIPLNQRGIDVLARAVQKGGAGRGGITVNINTQGNFDEQQLAASVSRHLTRVMREEALV